MAAEDLPSQWNPMEDDFRDSTFNSYNRGPGQDLPKPQERASGGVQVFVSNIPVELTDEGLSNYFRMKGMNPLVVKKCRPKQPGADTTFGFVTYATVKDCEGAINLLNGHKIGKHTLRVSLARPQEQRPRYDSTASTSSETGVQLRNGTTKEKIGGSHWSPAVDAAIASPQFHMIGGRGLSMFTGDSRPGSSGDSRPGSTGASRPGSSGDVGPSVAGRGMPRPKEHPNTSHGTVKPGAHFEIEQSKDSHAVCINSMMQEQASASGTFVGRSVSGMVGSKSIPMCSPAASSSLLPKSHQAANGEGDSNQVELQRGSGSGMLPPQNLCTVCHRIGSLRCGNCKQAYCGKACQQTDWPRHKNICPKKGHPEDEFASNFEIQVLDKRFDLLASTAIDEQGDTILADSATRYMAEWLPSNQLASGQKHRAEVCHFVNPSLFWIHLADAEGSLKAKRSEFEIRLNQSMANSHVEYKPVAGELCVARYSVDKAWYRVEIIRVEAEVTASFIDYGNEETLNFSAIRPIDTSFAQLPRQAIPCSLADVKPAAATSWSSSAVKVCTEAGLMLFAPVDVQCVVKATAKTPAQVQLFLSSGLELGACLQKAGLAVPLSPKRFVVAKSLHKDLNVGEQVKICITAETAVSPDQFKAQVVAVRHAPIVQSWMKMSSELGHASDQVSASSAHEYRVGDFVQARFAGAWYRARVLQVFADVDQLELEYIDYGNVEKKSSSDVFPLGLAFVDVPCMSCACVLECKATRKARQQGRWPDECTKAMLDMISKSPAFDGCVKVQSDELGRLVLDIPKLATVIDAAAAAVEATTLQASPQAKLVTAEFGLRLACPASDQDSDNALRLRSSAVDQSQDKVRSQNSSIAVKAMLTASTFGIKSGRVIAMVTYVSPTSAGLFYVQANSPECLAFYEMTKELASADLGLLPSIANAGVGDVFMGCYTVDKTWYRCRVLEVYQSKGEVRVYYVDFGNEEVLPVSSLRAVPTQFLSLPAQATPCRLNGTESLNQRVVFNKLQAYEMKKVNMSVLAIDPIDKEVRIVDVYDETGLHLNQQLRIENRAHALHTSDGRPAMSPSGFADNLLQKKPPPMRRHIMAESLTTASPKASNFNVMVTHIISPKQFYCQMLNTDAKNLATMMVAFTNEVVQGKSPAPIVDDWVVGELVVAKWKEDDCWYRGVVTSLDSSSANVRFVDYGNEAVVGYSDIRVPPSALLGIPLLGLQLSLFRFHSGYGSDELASLKQHFDKLVTGQLITASIVDKAKDEVLVVTLSNKNGEDIATALSSLISPKRVYQAGTKKQGVDKSMVGDRELLVKRLTKLRDEIVVSQEHTRKLQEEAAVIEGQLRQMDAL